MMTLVKSYDEMSDAAADIFAAQVKGKPDSVLGLATGTTPIGLYGRLAKLHRDAGLDFSAVRTVNLDEYCSLPAEHENSYRYFMNTQLFDHINIDKRNTFLPDGTASDFEAECRQYDARIDQLGGIDMQLLGIGNNGHIGFNEPAGYFANRTHRVRLTESTINANSRLFESVVEMPLYALTMGIRQIMLAREIVLIAAADKREIVTEALEGEITPQVPASILQVHPRLTVILAEN